MYRNVRMRPATKVGRYRTGSMWKRENTSAFPTAPKNNPNLFVMAGKIKPLKNSSSARGPMTITNNPMIARDIIDKLVLNGTGSGGAMFRTDSSDM